MLKALGGTLDGPGRRAGTSFEPVNQVFEVNVPTVVPEVVIAIPLLPFANASVDEMQTSASVFCSQFIIHSVLTYYGSFLSLA